MQIIFSNLSYEDHSIIPLNHSISIAIVRIITNINAGIILILEYSWIEQDGKRIAISKSKIKNRIITRKNFVENEDLFLEISLNPHSNCLFFSIRTVWLWEVIIIINTKKPVRMKEIIMKEEKFISFFSF